MTNPFPRDTSAPDQAYPPDLYAAVHSGNTGDVAYYRRTCLGARTVLELGCGWGRVAGALAEDGHAVTGIDISADLLARGRGYAPKVEFLYGDMTTIALGRTFDRVLIPYNSIYCLLDEAAVIAALTRSAEHLNADGLLIFDAYAADAFHDEAGRDQSWDDAAFVKTVRALGDTWDVYERSRWSRDAQRIDAIYEHVQRDGSSKVTSRIPQRYLLRAQLPRLLAEAGLDLVDLRGGFRDEQAEHEAPLLVVRARRSATA